MILIRILFAWFYHIKVLQIDTRTKSVATVVLEIQSLEFSEFCSIHQNLLSYILLINWVWSKIFWLQSSFIGVNNMLNFHQILRHVGKFRSLTQMYNIRINISNNRRSISFFLETLGPQTAHGLPINQINQKA